MTEVPAEKTANALQESKAPEAIEPVAKAEPPVEQVQVLPVTKPRVKMSPPLESLRRYPSRTVERDTSRRIRFSL